MRRTEARPTPVPGKSARAVQALEQTEQAVGEAHVEAGAVVGHRSGRAAACRCA
jgi:hypothetical protein